jgi:hypothetical protein
MADRDPRRRQDEPDNEADDTVGIGALTDLLGNLEGSGVGRGAETAEGGIEDRDAGVAGDTTTGGG